MTIVQRWTPFATVVVILAASLAVGWTAAVAGVLSGSVDVGSRATQTIGGMGYTLSGALGVLLGLYARRGGGGDDT